VCVCVCVCVSAMNDHVGARPLTACQIVGVSVSDYDTHVLALRTQS
jgi:hypothetical protein